MVTCLRALLPWDAFLHPPLFREGVPFPYRCFTNDRLLISSSRSRYRFLLCDCSILPRFCHWSRDRAIDLTRAIARHAKSRGRFTPLIKPDRLWIGTHPVFDPLSDLLPRRTTGRRILVSHALTAIIVVQPTFAVTYQPRERPQEIWHRDGLPEDQPLRPNFLQRHRQHRRRVSLTSLLSLLSPGAHLPSAFHANQAQLLHLAPTFATTKNLPVLLAHSFPTLQTTRPTRSKSQRPGNPRLFAGSSKKSPYRS